ncbi:MAG: flavin reductase family protein, partial [Muribaculaceae bacterium]|nr:flavin reductase family protein [Muribaculaceae bacterium]
MENPLYKIPYGLYVITANADNRDNGCISNTLQQVTAEPNQVSLCINKQNLTCEMIEKTKLFTASVISRNAPFS